MKSPRVFVDTNVLYPASLADLTLSAAEYGLFELVYSDHLLQEIERVPVDHKGLAPVHAQRFIELPGHGPGPTAPTCCISLPPLVAPPRWP